MGKLESVKQEQKLDYSLVPDYINVHVYATSFEAFKSKVEQYHKTFNLPVYVTEFAMHVSPIYLAMRCSPDRP